MNPIVTAILTLIQVAPTAITEIISVYNAVKSDLSATDQQAIDKALAAAQQADAVATARADEALDQASKR